MVCNISGVTGMRFNKNAMQCYDHTKVAAAAAIRTDLRPLKAQPNLEIFHRISESYRAAYEENAYGLKKMQAQPPPGVPAVTHTWQLLLDLTARTASLLHQAVTPAAAAAAALLASTTPGVTPIAACY